MAVFCEHGFHSLLQQGTKGFHAVVGCIIEQVQGRGASSHGQRIARKRAGLIDRPER